MSIDTNKKQSVIIEANSFAHRCNKKQKVAIIYARNEKNINDL